MAAQSGAIRLGRVAGVELYLHWSWFLVAAFEITSRKEQYASPLWNVLEYLALFGLVLLHEFGHALACRQTGGRADKILLWPLGGIAFVSPPPRPGATLWSIAAGPLVNVLFVPVFMGLGVLAAALGWADAAPNAVHLLRQVAFINLILLVFNLLPIYPLDGGQILQSLLWFVFGRARSLIIATVIGFMGVAGMVLLAVVTKSVWFGVLAVFILLSCWQGMRAGLALARLAKIPRREGFACPSCRAAPPAGPHWLCSACHTTFDTFETQAVCPKCCAVYAVTRCSDCGQQHPVSEWRVPPSLPR